MKTKKYYFTENFLNSVATETDEPYFNGEFEGTLRDRVDSLKCYNFIQKIKKDGFVELIFVKELPSNYDKNLIYVIDKSKDDRAKSTTTHAMFNKFLDHVSEVYDLIEDFVKHNRLEEAGYKRKSHFQKDKKNVEELILGTYKSRTQTYMSDIEHWCTRGFFGIKKPTIEDITKDDWNFNNEWAYWTCHSM